MHPTINSLTGITPKPSIAYESTKVQQTKMTLVFKYIFFNDIKVSVIPSYDLVQDSNIILNILP